MKVFPSWMMVEEIGVVALTTHFPSTQVVVPDIIREMGGTERLHGKCLCRGGHPEKDQVKAPVVGIADAIAVQMHESPGTKECPSPAFFQGKGNELISRFT